MDPPPGRVRDGSEQPGDDPRAAARWVAALLRDQAERWREGHRRPVEAYLTAYPHIADLPGVGLALAASEFLLRAARGERPDLGEYARRFPQWADQLPGEVEFLRGHAEPAGPTWRFPTRAAGAGFYTPPRDRLSWPLLPGYEVTDELGQGGMAVVYRARQTGLNRDVALKVMLAGALAAEPDRVRLRREAEAVARLRHPNVIQIHDIGERDGCLYLSLEYAPGGSLADKLDGRPLAPADAARLVEQVARGVQAAHDAGIVHRDLKPANVLLDADGVPKVTDFGLAKQRGEDRRLTATGVVAGTPAYMSPEQVFADAARIGPATDVYGLGGILYECLTGRPPFSAPTELEVMRRIADEEVVSVRRLQTGVPRDLETICLKCLQKDPARRYASAADVAADLARFRAGEPPVARPVGSTERAVRWARRHPAVPLLAVTLGLMILCVAGLMARSTLHAYQVAGHLRERELELHGVRGTLLRLDEAQARYADLGAATGDPAWAERHRAVAEDAGRHRADAARLSGGASDAAGVSAAAERVLAGERRALDLARDGRATDGWKLLQANAHQSARDEYAAAVGRFADRADAAADAELGALQEEAFWSLASATAVAGLIGAAAVGGWAALIRRRHQRAVPAAAT